jgi:hypothetical protein
MHQTTLADCEAPLVMRDVSQSITQNWLVMLADQKRRCRMAAFYRSLWICVLLVFAASESNGQELRLSPNEAKPFLGTWLIEMTEPAVFKGTHTVTIWERSGAAAASLQTNPNSPAIEATSIQRDDNMLVLTISHKAKPGPLMENGAPIWAVISLVLEDDTLKVAQMLERSQTIKRGTGKRQPN